MSVRAERRLWRAHEQMEKDDGEKISLGETVRRVLEVGLDTIGIEHDPRKS